MVDTKSPSRLFNPRRQTDLQAFGRQLGLGAGAVIAVIFGVMFLYLDGSWWLAGGIALGVFAISAGTTWLVTWKPSPTVTCRSCGGRGWIDDLTASGACPVCGGERFDYYRYRGESTALRETDIAGSELVENRSLIGLPWI